MTEINEKAVEALTPGEREDLNSLANSMGFGRTHDALRKLLSLTLHHWQPFANVPRNEPVLLLAVSEIGGFLWMADGIVHAKGWVGGCAVNYASSRPPTHWMPRPTLPQLIADQQQETNR